MDFTVSILHEMPESLHKALSSYLERHPDWDQDRVISAALSLFLLQDARNQSAELGKQYLKTMFDQAA